jgi:hypothetical protein
MASTINATPTSSGLISTADNSGVLALQTGGTTGLTVNAVQGVQALNCIGVGNATPSTSGFGITFPASQSASSDANTLDDYEEGTWTPVYVSSGGTLGSISYANREGKYTKIGNMVYISATFYTTAFAVGSGSGTLQIDGLPFTSHGNSAHSSYAMSDVRLFVVNNPSGARQVGSSTKITLYYRTTANGEASDFPVTSAGTGGANNLVTFAGCYTVS